MVPNQVMTGVCKVETQYMKNEILDERPRRRESAGTVIAKLAMIFAMVCVIASLIMVIGK